MHGLDQVSGTTSNRRHVRSIHVWQQGYGLLKTGKVLALCFGNRIAWAIAVMLVGVGSCEQLAVGEYLEAASLWIVTSCTESRM